LPDLSPDLDDNDNNDDKVKEGDHILYTVFTLAEEICAGSTISQRLARPKCEILLQSEPMFCPGPWISVFDRGSFDSPLERQTRDHAIELVSDTKLTNCKMYPISPLEQKELNTFILEGLSTGHICPSKSPMASPVFFVKKDGELWFIQDYQVLNAMTVKNRYLLPLINDLINRLKGAQFFTKLNV
jgi:hypothetical protein